MLKDTLIDGPGTQTAAYEQDCFLAWVETETLNGFLFRYGGVESCLTNRVSCQNNLVGREETLHALVCHAYLLGLFGE